MEQELLIRRLAPEQLPEALALAWEVFCQFEAPDYTEEGVQAFRRTLDDPAFVRQLEAYGAYRRPQLVGMLALRAPQHIALFFVRAACQRQGVGRALWDAARQAGKGPVFTVNSSPYAVEIYRRLGFAATAPEQVMDGIRYTPMRRGEAMQV